MFLHAQYWIMITLHRFVFVFCPQRKPRHLQQITELESWSVLLSVWVNQLSRKEQTPTVISLDHSTNGKADLSSLRKVVSLLTFYTLHGKVVIWFMSYQNARIACFNHPSRTQEQNKKNGCHMPHFWIEYTDNGKTLGYVENQSLEESLRLKMSLTWKISHSFSKREKCSFLLNCQLSLSSSPPV